MTIFRSKISIFRSKNNLGAKLVFLRKIKNLRAKSVFLRAKINTNHFEIPSSMDILYELNLEWFSKGTLGSLSET